MENELHLKNAGWLFSIFSIGIILASITLWTTEYRVWMIGGIVAINLMIIGLCRIRPRTSRIHAFHEGQLAGLKNVNYAVVRAGLFVTYGIAVGCVWAVSRITGKKFIESSTSTSTWKKHDKNERHQEPY